MIEWNPAWNVFLSGSAERWQREMARSIISATRTEAAAALTKLEGMSSPAIYMVAALHPLEQDVWHDGITFSRKELREYGDNLSNRPMNIDHHGLRGEVFEKSPYAKELDYPQNKTLDFLYNAEKDELEGFIQISDPETNRYIQDGTIKHVSVERAILPNGVSEFRKLSLLSPKVKPRDPKAEIKLDNGSIIAARAWYNLIHRGGMTWNEIAFVGVDRAAKLGLYSVAVELYAATGDDKYRDKAARFMVEAKTGAVE